MTQFISCTDAYGDSELEGLEIITEDFELDGVYHLIFGEREQGPEQYWVDEWGPDGHTTRETGEYPTIWGQVVVWTDNGEGDFLRYSTIDTAKRAAHVFLKEDVEQCPA